MIILKNQQHIKRIFAAGAKGGKQEELATGFKWITNAKIEVE
jgi:hypothetical protein